MFLETYWKVCVNKTRKLKTKQNMKSKKQTRREAKASYNDIYAIFRKEKVHTGPGEGNFWEKFSRKIRATLLNNFFFLQWRYWNIWKIDQQYIERYIRKKQSNCDFQEK